MTMLHGAIITLSLAVVTISAAGVKKSDDILPTGSQPVYQANPNGGGGGGQYSMPSQYGGNQAVGQHQEHGPQSAMQQAGSQSNLYYYYYPVQDKPKDYGHSSASASGPVSHPSPSAVHDSAEHGPMDAAASGSEISYSTPELSSPHEYSSPSQGFDAQTLSNLASQFQQQYFNNVPPSTYDSNAAAATAASMGYGPQAEASAHMPSQVHPGYSNPLAQAHLAGFAQGTPYPGQHAFGFGAGAGQAVAPQSTEVSGIASGLKKYGLTSILMPVLAIAGLSLLLPTVTNLGTTTTKTKRSIQDSALQSYIEKMDVYYKMYNKAMEKEECMNRMICELGDAVSDVRGRSVLLMAVENLAPQWMEKKMVVFKNGALSKDNAKCKKYSC